MPRTTIYPLSFQISGSIHGVFPAVESRCPLCACGAFAHRRTTDCQVMTTHDLCITSDPDRDGPPSGFWLPSRIPSDRLQLPEFLEPQLAILLAQEAQEPLVTTESDSVPTTARSSPRSPTASSVFDPIDTPDRLMSSTRTGTEAFSSRPVTNGLPAPTIAEDASSSRLRRSASVATRRAKACCSGGWVPQRQG